MTAPTCAVCAKPLADGAYACTRCTARARGHLLGIGELIADARAVAYGLDSTGSGVGAAGVPGSRVPLDLHAAAKLDRVQRELTSWVDAIAHHRGATRPWFIHRDGDPIALSAAWLPDHLEWMRHRDDVAEFAADIEACTRVVRGIVDGPAERRYLGPCEAPLLVEVVPEDAILGIAAEHETRTCDGDVYGRPGAEQGTCRTCGAKVDQGERRAWLDGEVRQYAYTAKEIADAYGINIKTIRSWRDRGRIVEHGAGFFNLGEVLDLAAREAARREETRARRQRDGAAA